MDTVAHARTAALPGIIYRRNTQYQNKRRRADRSSMATFIIGETISRDDRLLLNSTSSFETAPELLPIEVLIAKRKNAPPAAYHTTTAAQRTGAAAAFVDVDEGKGCACSYKVRACSGRLICSYRSTRQAPARQISQPRQKRRGEATGMALLVARKN